MSISPINPSAQTGLVPNNLLGYSSNGQSAIEITPTSIVLGGNLTTTPVYITVNATTGLSTTNPNGIQIGSDIDMNLNDITEVNSITRLDGGDLSLQTQDGGNINLTNNGTGGDINLGALGAVNVSPSLIVSNGIDTNTISALGYTTRNSVQNLTHYLNFSDSSATGTGAIQKTAGISCNPSTNTITATTFNGVASNASQVALTSDNTNGTYYIPFSKTTGPLNNALFIDNITGPLTYNPVNATLTATNLVGSIQLPTNTPTVVFSGTTLTISFGTTGSFFGYKTNITGTTNTINTLALTNGLVNGCYTVVINNSGSGDLTIAGTFSPSSLYLTTNNTTLTIASGEKAIMIIRKVDFLVGGQIFVIDKYELF